MNFLAGEPGFLTSDQGIRTIFTAAYLLLVWIIQSAAIRIVRRTSEDSATIYRRQGAIRTIFSIAIAAIIAFIWYREIKALATLLGLVAAAFVIINKELILSLSARVYIAASRVFRVGDRIQVGMAGGPSVIGDVVDQRLLYFSMLEIGNWVGADQSTGRVVHVPNWKAVSETIANYTEGIRFIWNELTVPLTLDSNWQHAKQMALQIANKVCADIEPRAAEAIKNASKKKMLYYRRLTPAVYVKLTEKGIVLSIRYLCEPQRRRDTEQEIWEQLLTAVGEMNDVHIVGPRIIDPQQIAPK